MQSKPREISFLIVISFLIYAQTLWKGFDWDDNLFIILTARIKDPQFISFFFGRGFCEAFVGSCDFYRPLFRSPT